MQTRVFQRFSGVSSNFLRKAFMSRTLFFFVGDFKFDILLTALDVFHFLCFIFCWGVTSLKGCLHTKYFSHWSL